MNCQRFDQVVGELARARMMEAEVRTEALAHGEDCERCAARLRDEETLTRGLRLLAADMESQEAPAAVELKLREAFRERRVVAPVAVTSSRSRYWLVAVAAALLLVMSVAAMWWRSEAPEQTVAENPKPAEVSVGPSETAPAPAPAPKEVENVAQNETPKKQISKPGRRNIGNRKTPEAQVAHHVQNEIATDFVPLGDMTAVIQDGGQIIRVKLPRSALVKFGFPVNMDRYNENVKADVLIGVDGLARAIRFVQ